MKKIGAGIVIVFGLSFLSLGNIGFADPNFVGPPTQDQWQKENCEKQEQMVRENGKCVNDIKYDNCIKSGKSKESCECITKGGILLNTNIPFIGRCITKDGNTADGDSAIAGISSALTQIFMTLIITGGFAMVIRGGAQIAMGQNKDGMAKIRNVVIAFAALGSLGIILRLINPNFFK